MELKHTVTMALAKGRILDATLPLLERAGIELTERPGASRKLVLDTNLPQLKAFIVRTTDVPAYVGYGAADFGIAGKDTLIEADTSQLYEPLDLNIALCRLAVAGVPGTDLSPARKLKIATKYVNAARDYFTQRGQQVEIIKLYGSMELAPLVGLADAIVDLVDTGSTLKANGLIELEDVCNISSRLVVNKAAAKLKHASIDNIVKRLRAAVEVN